MWVHLTTDRRMRVTWKDKLLDLSVVPQTGWQPVLALSVLCLSNPGLGGELSVFSETSALVMSS